jgi:radical SAM protein with 4Fe4S-binding SPASM domain
MRVCSHIKVLDGARRGAVYDLRAKQCWPASEVELAGLRRLAAGQNPPLDTRTLVLMRQRNWIEAGAPVRHDLTLTVPRRDSQPQRLAQVWLEVTNSCNLKCRHCYAHSGPESDRSAELSLEEWRRVVDDAIDYGVEVLTFIGGEPTIRIDLVDDLAAHARSRSPDIVLTMYSNLAIGKVTERTLDVVERHGIQFHTTIYGMDAATHDGMTLRPGSWAVTMDAIERCLARGIGIRVALFVDMTATESVEAHKAWLRQRGISDYSIRPPIRTGRGESQEWESRCNTNKLPGVFDYSEHQWEVGRSGHNCYHDHMTIMPDGNSAPCIMTRDATYGNVARDGIASVLASDTYRQFASLSKDAITGCKDCEFRYACFDCRPAAMSASGDLLRKPDCGYDPRLDLGAPLAAAD